MRIEEAGGCFHDRDGLVVHRNGEEAVLVVAQNSYELQTKILGVELGGEAVGNCLLCTGGDLDGVLLGGEVANDTGLSILLQGQRSANNGDANGRGLVVVDGQASFGGMAVDELDAKDLRLGERDRDLDVQVGRLRLFLYDLFDLLHTTN